VFLLHFWVFALDVPYTITVFSSTLQKLFLSKYSTIIYLKDIHGYDGMICLNIPTNLPILNSPDLKNAHQLALCIMWSVDDVLKNIFQNDNPPPKMIEKIDHVKFLNLYQYLDCIVYLYWFLICPKNTLNNWQQKRTRMISITKKLCQNEPKKNPWNTIKNCQHYYIYYSTIHPDACTTTMCVLSFCLGGQSENTIGSLI